jgi:uncharacterized membrane protein
LLSHTSIVFPLGLLVTADSRLYEVAYWIVVAGILAGVVSAPFGLIDWLAIPAGTRAKRIGALHGIGNVVMLLLFGPPLANGRK